MPIVLTPSQRAEAFYRLQVYMGVGQRAHTHKTTQKKPVNTNDCVGRKILQVVEGSTGEHTAGPLCARTHKEEAENGAAKKLWKLANG